MDRDPRQSLIPIRMRQFQMETRKRTGLRIRTERLKPRRKTQCASRARSPTDPFSHPEVFSRALHAHRPRSRPRRKHASARIVHHTSPASTTTPSDHQTNPLSTLRTAPAAHHGNCRHPEGLFVQHAFPGQLHKHPRHRVLRHQIQRHQRPKRVLSGFPARRRIRQIHRTFQFVRQQRRPDMHRPDLRRIRTGRITALNCCICDDGSNPSNPA